MAYDDYDIYKTVFVVFFCWKEDTSIMVQFQSAEIIPNLKVANKPCFEVRLFRNETNHEKQRLVED